ncbi:MAG: Crp/Fnr family transcriptional regulator [Chloroflexaceae bacterium]|nr:Crp/Fnr family transcriptional regulator [Chloroflexaceae bacterium]
MLLPYLADRDPSADNRQEGRRLHFFDKGETVPLVAQGVWQVYRGVVQLSKLHASGDELLLGWAKPLTFFGTWLTCIETYQAKALSEVYLKWYALSEIETSPHLAHIVLAGVSRRIRQTEALLAISGLRRVEERLQELLALLKLELGQAVAEGTRLEVRLTHQNIANAIGTTRVTVTRLLGDFQRQGLIAIDGDRHLVLLETSVT